MHKKMKADYFDPVFLLSAFFYWFLCALILLIICSIILNESGASEKGIGYSSSVISFISAVAAGTAAGRKRNAGAFYTAILTAVALIIALLTLGFVINGSLIEPSSVMSVVSFTFSGCLVGVFFLSEIGRKKKKYRPKLN